MSQSRKEASLFGAIIRPLQTFLATEAASGALLLLCALLALVWANFSPDSYANVFQMKTAVSVGTYSTSFTVQALINDGLMSVFFFVVGMEIKRELALGELNSLRKAGLPAIAALGGMIVPALIFVLLNLGGPGINGWGIPMATDIAFCIAILAILKNRVPRALVVFLIALAIFDDIGGILVIALFYGHGLSVAWLGATAIVTLLLLVVGRSYVTNGLVYAGLGILLWWCLHNAGIHSTIAGVILGLIIPCRPIRASRHVLSELGRHVSELSPSQNDDEYDAAKILAIEEKLEDLQAPLPRFIHAVHPFSAFVIMPLFALANSGVRFDGGVLDQLVSSVALGCGLGLFLGKPLGIFLFTSIAIKLKISPPPRDSSLKQLFAVSILAGVGFTVALFIAALAFQRNYQLLDQAKIGILLGSILAGVIGFLLLRLFSGKAAAGSTSSS